MIQTDQIEPDSDQPRKSVDPEHISELAASIKQLGVLQPITVRYIEERGKYRIIAGECRFRAAGQVGLEEVPCWVRTPEQNQVLLEQVIENWQRADLNPFDLAESLAILQDANGYTQRELAGVTGKSAGEISKILSLLELAPEVQSVARQDHRGHISKRHLYALRPFECDKQVRLLKAIEEGRYTAEALEKLSERYGKTSDAGRRPNWQRRSFKTKHATVRIEFRKPDITDDDILQALREVRQQITDDAA